MAELHCNKLQQFAAARGKAAAPHNGDVPSCPKSLDHVAVLTLPAPQSNQAKRVASPD
jgi:hypothetical protein